MKKILLVVTTLAAIARVDLCLASGEIILSGGYAYSFMEEVNDQLDRQTGNYGELRRHHHGMFGAIEAMLLINENVGLGPKLEALACMPGEVEWRSLPVYYRNSYTGTLIPLLMGINILLPLGRAWAVLGGYVGYGWAFLHVEDNNDNTLEYRGGSFVAEVKGGLRFNVSGRVSLALELGYRHARVNEMNLAESEFPLKEGDPLTIRGENVDYDFSGIFAGVGVIFRL